MIKSLELVFHIAFKRHPSKEEVTCRKIGKYILVNLKDMRLQF